MISVGDGKLGLGLGFGGGSKKMKETEFEEGEACFYQNYDDDYTIDPDTALSYIDEKLQDVLGHFQKDFEGGVSAENLGSKFGGYGSFLPSYHRSPVRQHPPTPQKIHSSNSPRSLFNRKLERVQTNSVPSSASLLPSRGSTSATVASTHLFNGAVDDYSEKKENMSSAQFVGPCSDKNFPESSEKSLRVRIKEESDNLSTRKNAEIYSGLGLDVSPSVSADGSPIGSEVSREPFKPPEESPTSILQIMTSFPVYGSLMLSPLPDDLIFLSEKQNVQAVSKCRSSQQVSNAKHSGRVKSGKRKSLKKNDFPVELKDHVNKDSQNANGLISKKEKDVRLADGVVEDSGVGNKVKRESSSDLVKRETLEAESACDIGSIVFPSGSAMGFKVENVNSSNDMLVYPKEVSYLEREIIEASATADSDVCDKKDIRRTKHVDHSVSVSKKKPKGSRSQVVRGVDVAKGSSNIDNPLVSKNRKSEHAIIVLPKSEVEDSKPQKDLGKVRDTYRDFFGDMELEHDDNDADSEDRRGANKLAKISNVKSEDFQAVEKSASKIMPKDSSYSKKRENVSIPCENSKADPTEAVITGSGLTSEPLAETGALIPLVKEDWVCCDKCQKWRLLPLGANTANLPEKWLCSMLDWLPGMNRCSFSEEETTKALVASHQLPAHGGGPHGSSSVDTSVFARKKGNRVKSVSTLVNQDGPVSNSVKAALVKDSSFNGVNRSPLVNQIGIQCLSKPSTLEKHRHKQKENKNLLEQHSGEIKRERDAEPGHPIISKKAKVDDDRIHDQDRSLGKVVDTSVSGLPLTASDKNFQKNDTHIAKNRKRDTNNKLKDPSRNSRVQSTERNRKLCESPLPRRSDLPEVTSENDGRKKKKARISKSVVGNGSDGSNNLKSVKDQQLESDLGVESLKRDLGLAQHSQATSSSSKVSGSNKNRTIMSKEVKGSPVESVSSSPSRFVNQDKSVKMKSLDGKDGFGDVALFTTGSPKRCSDGGDERSDVEHTPYDQKKRALKNSVQEQVGSDIPVVEHALIGKDEAKHVADDGRKVGQFKYRGKNRVDDKGDEISSNKLISHELPLYGKGRSETEKSPLRVVSGSQKENETVGDETLKSPKPTSGPEKQSENQLAKITNLTPNGRKVKNVEPPSPARRESSSQAGHSAVKEAKDLKHLADRLKNSGSIAESTSFYFQAALKFLNGASLLESCNSESAKKGDMIMSMQVYSSTAKLCGFCAHEYEKCKDFAAAALAYKLMEVAYMRVIYSSNTNASKDRLELQAALQSVNVGESPSSSVSEVDNQNNSTVTDKAPSVKGVGSPQVISNNVITARNRTNLARMLNFAQDVNYAMEASKKSRNAFVAATARSKESQGREGIKSVKKALDFNFHDVERLLRLVRLAMDAISL